MLKAMQDAKCSPEEFGKLAGISGMTIRRWAKLKAGAALDSFYEPGVRQAIFKLISQGRLAADQHEAAPVPTGPLEAQHAAALVNLGLHDGFQIDGTGNARALEALSSIGAQTLKQDAVRSGSKQFSSFKNLGREWSDRIGLLWRITRKKDLPSLEKLVAFGALFYLLTVIDFIPDQLPFVGLVDDFAILGLAVTYYVNRKDKRDL